MDKNNRILIVDDDPRIRATYREILSPPLKPVMFSKGIALYRKTVQEMKPIPHRSYELILAERGEEGIRAVEKAVEQQNPFAAAFIDMKMPGINGAETSKRIWTVDPDIKIAIVTAFGEYTPDDIIRVTGREDILYLRKPFYPEVIRQLARYFIKQWNLVKTLSGSVCICANCKKIRDDKGYWNCIENYIGSRTEVEFSHSICPDCAIKLYPNFYHCKE